MFDCRSNHKAYLNLFIMEEVGRQFGADGVEIDAHMLCAEDHLPYQGQQFSNEEFEQIQDSLDRPFGEWNCRHSWHPSMLGISPPAWTPEQLEEMRRFSTEPITVDGRTKTRYKWSQEMRRIETAVRQQKDTANLARVTGDEALRRRCQTNILELNRYYKELSEKVGLQPEFQRTYVAGFRDVNTKNDASKMSVFDQATENEKRIQWPPKGEPISAKEFKELKSYAAERGIALSGFRNSDVDTGLAREAIDALHRVATVFPKILGDEKHPLTISLAGFLRSNDFADKPLETSHIIRLNRDAFRDRSALKSEYEKLAQEGHFVKGTTIPSIMYHEAGHMVADVYGLDANQLVRTITGSKSRIEALEEYYTQLSIYAGVNEDESIAESFSAYYGLPGEKPKIVVDLFKYIL